jgi:hypothetical protein
MANGVNGRHTDPNAIDPRTGFPTHWNGTKEYTSTMSHIEMFPERKRTDLLIGLVVSIIFACIMITLKVYTII